MPSDLDLPLSRTRAHACAHAAPSELAGDPRGSDPGTERRWIGRGVRDMGTGPPAGPPKNLSTSACPPRRTSKSPSALYTTKRPSSVLYAGILSGCAGAALPPPMAAGPAIGGGAAAAAASSADGGAGALPSSGGGSGDAPRSRLAFRTETGELRPGDWARLPAAPAKQRPGQSGGRVRLARHFPVESRFLSFQGEAKGQGKKGHPPLPLKERNAPAMPSAPPSDASATGRPRSRFIRGVQGGRGGSRKSCLDCQTTLLSGSS